MATTFHRNSPYLIFFDTSNDVSNIDKNTGYLISIDQMEKIRAYAQNYIDTHKSEDAIDLINFRLEKQYDKEDLEEREARIESKKDKVKVDLDCHIYLLKDSIRGVYKIGRARDVKTRVAQIKTANAGVVFIASYPGKESDEINLHNTFDEQNKRVSGEWFKLSCFDLLFIDEYFSTV